MNTPGFLPPAEGGTDEPATRFEGRLGVVTGGASGIGRAVTVALASRGAYVLAVDLDVAGLEQTATLAGRERVHLHVADVSNERDVESYAAAAAALGPAPSFFFNNAGIEDEQLPIAEMSIPDWDRVLAVNLRGAFLGLRAMITMMRDGSGGSIVNTGSVLSMTGCPRAGAYTASKHAVLGLTRCAAAEEAQHGIRVNAICPGPIDTPLQRRAELGISNAASEGRAFFEEKIPTGRYGTVE